MRYHESCLVSLLIMVLLPLCVAAIPMPPEMPYTYDYQLPPGPAQPIIEFHLTPPTPRPPAPAPVSPPAKVVVPALPATGSAPVTQMPETDSEPAPTEPEQLSESREPDLFARPGEPFTIALDGGSWLFTAALPEDADIDYRGRNREEAGVRFSFVARDLGRFLLTFVKGSSQGEGAVGRTLVIEVLPENDFLARIGATGEEKTAEQADEDSAPLEQDNLSPTERFELAWEAALAGSPIRAALLANDPQMDGVIDETELLAARFIFSRLAGIVDSRLFDRINSLSAVARKSFSGTLLAGINRFGLGEQEQLLRFSLDGLGEFVEIDRYLFNLAELYQGSGPFRNIDLAVAYYSRLIEDFPLSPLWDEARRKKVYLERHFLLIR